MDIGTWGNLSILAVTATVLWAFLFRPLLKKIYKLLFKADLSCGMDISRLHLITGGVFIAGILMFLPVCCDVQSDADAGTYIYSVLTALFNAMRLFFLGTENEILEKLLTAGAERFGDWFKLYVMALLIAAPLLTFGNILSIFQNMLGEIYLRYCRFRRIFIMSELNPQSIALAESIANGQPSKFPLIVFCDVFKRNEEENYELVQRARDMHAICLKKDVSHLKFCRIGRAVEFFLIGANDSEDISQAIKLTEKLKKRSRRITIHLFSSDPSTDYILDSLDLGDNVLSRKFGKIAPTSSGGHLPIAKWVENYEKLLGSFSLRHIDPIEQLVHTVLTYNDYEDYRAIMNAAQSSGDNTISVTILGMGRYGMQFLKTAAWFYQCYRFKVEFNVFDLGDENGNAEKRVMQACPELLKTVPPMTADAYHHICFFPETDCFSSDFDEKLLEIKERMAKTNLVFVALGDDDKNIRAARMVRTAFARLAPLAGTTPCDPFIYAVVYDDEKATNLNNHTSEKDTNDQNEKIIHIRYIGARTTCYTYPIIAKARNLESTAFKHHLDWASKENQLRICYESAHNDAELTFRQELDAQDPAAQAGKPIVWGDEDYFAERDAEGKLRKDASGNKIVDYTKPANTDELRRSASRYIRESYCRNSSIAKAMHKEAIEKIIKAAPHHSPVCACETCTNARITEHMRWNAYMRSNGYRLAEKEIKNAYPKAQFHNDLVPWNELPCRERYKD